jgi:hypothetical protein
VKYQQPFGNVIRVRKDRMPEAMLRRIRSKISAGSFDLTIHAVDEMAEDTLDILDIETAILCGKIIKMARDALGRVRYTIRGIAADESGPVAIVGRFTESGRFLIITVYRVPEAEL